MGLIIDIKDVSLDFIPFETCPRVQSFTTHTTTSYAMENEWNSGSSDYYDNLMEMNLDLIDSIADDMNDFFHTQADTSPYPTTTQEEVSRFKKVFEEILADEGEFQDEDPTEFKRMAQAVWTVSQRELAFAMGNHPRLGIASSVNMLDMELVSMILDLV